MYPCIIFLLPLLLALQFLVDLSLFFLSCYKDYFLFFWHYSSWWILVSSFYYATKTTSSSSAITVPGGSWSLLFIMLQRLLTQSPIHKFYWYSILYTPLNNVLSVIMKPCLHEPIEGLFHVSRFFIYYKNMICEGFTRVVEQFQYTGKSINNSLA